MKRTALFCLLLALLTGCAYTPDAPSPSVFPEAVSYTHLTLPTKA